MAYFNYHAKIFQKIKNGELKSYHFEKNYKNIGFALVLCFESEKYPIREPHFEKYFDLIGNLYNTKKVGDNYVTIANWTVVTTSFNKTLVFPQKNCD